MISFTVYNKFINKNYLIVGDAQKIDDTMLTANQGQLLISDIIHNVASPSRNSNRFSATANNWKKPISNVTDACKNHKY
jgi:hypothetical protein